MSLKIVNEYITEVLQLESFKKELEKVLANSKNIEEPNEVIEPKKKKRDDSKDYELLYKGSYNPNNPDQLNKKIK